MVKSYIHKVSMHYNISYVFEQGYKPKEFPSRNSSTLYVTIMRDPVERFLDHYRYNQRWDCNDLQNSSHFTPTLGNGLNVSFQDFAMHEEGLLVRYLANCGQNCFARWSSGVFISKEASSEYLEYHARKQLWEYDLIISFEKLKDPAYTQSIETMFGGVPGLSEPSEVFCDVDSEKANKKHPLRISDEQIKGIRRWNQIDIRLYKELADCKMGSSFPKKSLFAVDQMIKPLIVA